MRTTAGFCFLLAGVTAVVAHGSHGGGMEPGETIQQYAQRHMFTEHHIDSFDLRSFFQLHDLDRNGYWDREEVEAIYGVHHVYSQKKSKDDIEHQAKADKISSTVFSVLDKNNDNVISPEELEAVGLDGLPNFDELGAEGHHYDVESEFFLHHEEQFHSTPETQTDESYNHPEDLEHFAHHEQIEYKEAVKEAKYEGLNVEEVLKAHHDAEAEADAIHQANLAKEAAEKAAVPEGMVGHDIPVVSPTTPPKPKVTRQTPPEKQEPHIKFHEASEQKSKQAEWGTGEKGYQAPHNPAEKLRKNAPYKERMQYKFRRSWGDF